VIDNTTLYNHQKGVVMAHVIDSRTALPTQATRQLEIIANQESARKFFMPTPTKNLNAKKHPNIVINQKQTHQERKK
jgi:hypothetical protein